jgi:hypothetical protein
LISGDGTSNIITHETVALNFHLVGEEGALGFDELADCARRFQREKNPVYRRFEGFDYLPIEAFKRADVAAFSIDTAEAVFLSSGTGDSSRSRHFVGSLDVYKRSIITHFGQVFGREPRTIVAHLPSYDELGDSSSLVVMLKILIEEFGTPESAFILDPVELKKKFKLAASMDEPILLFGAAFGLLSLVESQQFALPPDSVIIETGGTKTYRREIERTELHARLASGFGVEIEQITSEYGMCELLSQFYMRNDGIFYPPPWVSFKILDPENSNREKNDGEAGALAVFDLANIYSVSAILTADRAIRRGDGFELHGRLSGAELRGCNFLVEDLIGNY